MDVKVSKDKHKDEEDDRKRKKKQDGEWRKASQKLK